VSWWLLCRPRGGFEGGHAGTCIRSSSVRRLEGLADGGTWAAQRPAWRRPVSTGPHSVGVALQCPRWQHSGVDGHTGSGVTEGTCSVHLAPRPRPGRVPGWWLYAPRGRCCPLSRGAHGGRTRAGGAVPKNDADHPAQHLYNAGDGCTAMGCSNSARI
jgi:hypothetical protein